MIKHRYIFIYIYVLQVVFCKLSSDVFLRDGVYLKIIGKA